MKGIRLASIAAAAIVPALVFAAPAHADPDVDFANELHTYGIYGQKDYNAWIGKITCQRLYNGLDQDADKSATVRLQTTYQRTPPPSRHGSSSVQRCARTVPTSCRSSKPPHNSKESEMLIKVSVAAAAVSVAAMVLPAVASADASDDYPIPNRILKTTCTVDQYMAAVRDVEPIYYQRYMIDYNNRPPDIEQGARDRIYWFFSLDYAGRRQYSEDTATNVYYEQMATHWGNWAKLFFNNKGVAAHGTDVCASYPPSDPSVWNWGDVSASPNSERSGHAVLECGGAAIRSAVSSAVGVSACAERSDRRAEATAARTGRRHRLRHRDSRRPDLRRVAA